MNETVRAWLQSAEMDLENVRILKDNEFLTPVSCFHSQQCVEKSFKALLEDRKMTVPKTHDLLKLFSLVKNFSPLQIDIIALQQLNDLYIDARYPGDFGLLPEGKPSISETEEFYQFALSIYSAVVNRISG